MTNGHLDVIQRACTLFDELIVAVAFNDQKHKSTLFSIDERIELLRETCAHNPNVRVVRLEGLLVDFAKQEKVEAIVRGPSSHLRFRVRVSNGIDEPEDGTNAGDHIYDAKGRVHLY